MLHAQKFAKGKWLKLVDKTYIQGDKIPGLKGYTEHMFTTLTTDTPSLHLTIYQKETDYVILMTLEEGGVKTITDVLEVKAVKKNQQFLISQCTIHKEIGSDLIVLVQNPPQGSLKAKPLKAWRADRDKIHFKKTTVAGLSCLFEDP